MPALVHTHPSETIRDAIRILHEYGVSQMPVVGPEPPVVIGEVAGSVSERELLSAVFEGRAALTDSVEKHMEPPLPLIGSTEDFDDLPQGAQRERRRDGHRGRQAARRPHPPRPAGRPCMSEKRSAHDKDAWQGFATRAIHAGYDPDPQTGAVNVPIYATSTFAQDGVGGMRGGYEYARTGNPTRTALEANLAALEGGAFGRAFSSGMAATDTALRSMLRPGDHIVIPDDAYGGTFRLIDKVFTHWGDHLHDGRRQRRRRHPGRHHAGDEGRLDRDAHQPAAEHRRHRGDRRRRPRRRT